MQSTIMSLVRQRGCTSKTFSGMTCTVAIGLAGLAMTEATALTSANSAVQYQLKQDRPTVEVRARGGGAAVRSGGAVRRTTVVGPSGNAASRTVVRGGAVARPGVAAAAMRPGRWVRPAHYHWRPGGAIAAGAAIGFVAAATAAAWAGSPPAPGYCWYYTDPSRTQGFWDVCP
jgi:hypothetical protein